MTNKIMAHKSVIIFWSFWNKLKNPIVSTSFYFILITGLVKVFQFFLFSHLAKALGVSLFGVFGLLYTYQVTISTFSNVGIIEKLPSQISLLTDPSKKDELYGKTNTFFLILSVISFAIILLYGLFDKIIIQNLASFLFTSLSAILISFFTVQSSFFRFDLKYLPSVLVSNIPLLLSLIGLYVASLFGLKLEYIILFSLFGLLIGLFVLLFSKLTYGFEAMKVAEIVSEFKTIWPFLFIAIFSLFSGYGANFLISKILKIEDVGVFTFFITITSTMHLIANSMNLVWAPKFYLLFKESDHTKLNSSNKRFYLFEVLILFAVAFCIFLALAFFNNLFVDYKPHFFKLSILFVAYLFNVPWYMNTNYYIATNRSKELLKIVSISGIIGLVALYFLMLEFGAYGIYIGFFIGYLAKSILIGYDSYKTWKSDTPWLIIFILSLILLVGSYFLSK